MIIIYRMFKISLGAQDRFGHWLGLGLASSFAIQTVYTLGANFGAWPLTGVTLAPLAFGKAACLAALLAVWMVLGISESAETTPAGYVPRKRVKTVRWAYAAMVVLILWTVGKAIKIGVLDRDSVALARYGPRQAMNRRVATRYATLPRGDILARTSSVDYDSVKVIAGNAESGNGREYPLGPASWPVVGVSCPYNTTGGESIWRSRLTGAYHLVQEGPIFGDPDKALETVLLADWRAEHHPLWHVRSNRDDLLKPRNVQSTIISSLQLEAYQKLSDYLTGSQYRTGTRPRKGAILLVDVQTGEYLAKAQFPSPDPNAISSDWSSWDSAVTDSSGVLDYNGNIIDFVENTDRAPGSTAKLNTIMALLSLGQGNREFWCGPGVKVNGHEIHDFGGASHGWVDAAKIIKYSCNKGASQAAKAVGPSKLLSLYRSKLRYQLPHMEHPEDLFRKNYDKIAFGQVMSASLMELMTTVCAIARDGEAIELHCIQKRPEDVEHWSVCSADVAARLSKYMLEVAKPGGTAFSVYNGKVAWPSKTGSAEVAGAKKTDAWFAGFAPANNPKVAFVVWVEEDGTGSNMAKQLGLVSLVKAALAAEGRVED
jgi:hypothetical protein